MMHQGLGKMWKRALDACEKIAAWLNRYQTRRRQKKRLSTGSFKALCAEINDVAVLSSRLWTEDILFQKRVGKIIEEIEKLDSMLEKRAFDRLPLKKKDELRRQLIHSRQELMHRVETAPCPTERIQ